MKSLLNRIYTFRQKELKHDKENFLSEILGFCLQEDETFQRKFLTSLGLNKLGELEVDTQKNFGKFGRPDILITSASNFCLIIECKIGAPEGDNQLDKYANLLLSEFNHASKHLVYLTKFYEEIKAPKNVNFMHIRWFDIFTCSLGSTNSLTIELSKFLIEEKMSQKIQLKRDEINAIKSFNETYGKMYDVLDSIKDIMNNITTLPNRKSISIPTGNMCRKIENDSGITWSGFYQYEDNEEIQLYVGHSVKRKGRNLLINI